MTTVTKSVVLPVDVDEAFTLLTEPERLRRWQTVTARIDLRVGGDYRWTVVPGAVATGTVREVEPGKRLVLGWGWEDNEEVPADSSTLTVTVTPVAGGTEVTLVHEGLTGEQATAHAQGWEHFLGRLEKLATTGDAGQDEWAWAPEDLDPVVATEAILAAVQPVLRGLEDADLSAQTPCPEYDAGGLVEHLLQSLAQLGRMAGFEVLAEAEGTIEERVSVTAAQAVDAWRARGLEGNVPGPGGTEMPAAFAASILPVELLLHGWDLAQASGQVLRVSDEVVTYATGLAQPLVTGGRGRSFGDEVEAGPDASALERLIAFSGRTAA